MRYSLRLLRVPLTLIAILALVAAISVGCGYGKGRHGPWFSAQNMARTIPYACTAHGNAQWGSNWAKTWLTGASGCASGYPIQYLRLGCYYPPRTGEYWYDGATRKGNGSSTSNYSYATCTQYAHGVVGDVYLWYNLGLGWADAHYYHL